MNQSTGSIFNSADGRSKRGEDLSKARILIFDAKQFARHQIRIALNSLGFWSILDTSDPYLVPQLLAEQKFDLLIAGIERQDDGVADLVRNIRHQECGRDPFIPIILTAWSPPQSLVSVALNSGADDLLIWPFSIGQIGERIQVLVTSRKSFVVTETYLGPDRRGEADRSGTYKAIEVPNSLKASIENDTSKAPSEKVVAATMTRLRDEKIRCEARRVKILTQQILKLYEDDRGDLAQNYLGKVDELSAQLQRSIAGTPFAHLAELAAAVCNIAGEFRGNIGRGLEKELELFDKTARALVMAVEAEGGETDTAHDISDEIRRHAGDAQRKVQADAVCAGD